MGKIVWHDDGRYTIYGSMNRKQIAVELDKSDKQLRKEMREAKLFYGNSRILSTRQIDEIIKALGPPVIHGVIDP